MNPSPFRADGVQFAWDSTSIKLIETCLRKYQYKMIEGWSPLRKSVHLIFGGLYATALEHFYKALALGSSPDEALVTVVHEALIASWDFEKNESIPFDHPTKTRENLIRTIIWYVDYFAVIEDTVSTVKLSDGKPAVEYSFKLEIDDGNLLCGHIDRLVEYGGQTYVMDQKTTGTTLTPRYFDQFSPDSQMSAYTYAGEIIYNMPVKGVIIDAAQIAVGFSRFARGFSHRTQPQLDEWYDNTLGHIRRAQDATRRGDFPLTTTSCGNYGGCEFRGVCSRTPSVREQMLKADFVKGKPWNPLEER